MVRKLLTILPLQRCQLFLSDVHFTLLISENILFLGNQRYIIDKQLGKGTFGVVFKATDLSTSSVVAVKYQKPPNKWEFYICRELQSRLTNHPLREHFMDVSTGYFSKYMF